jgi:MATE family multidrug resistance protein
MDRRSTVGAEIAALLRLAAPLAIASGGQALMGVVDTAVCGRAGAAALAGAGLGNVLYFAVAVLGMGAMLGLDPLVSQAIGAGDPRRARGWLWQGTWLALAGGLLLAIPMALVPLTLEPLGIEPEVARQGGGFLLLRLPGLVPLLYFTAARAYLQGVGSTRAIVASTVAGNVLNLAGDLLFVFGGAGLPAWAGPLRSVPAMGAPGSALATTLVTLFQAGALALAASRVPVPGGARGLRRPAADELRRVIRVGLPVGLHMGAEVGIFALVGVLAGRLGAAAIAAHQIAIAYASLTFTVAVGVGNAGSVRVGWAVGAGDAAGVRRAGLTAFGAGAGLMSLAAVAFLLFPRALARAMTDDPAVVAAAGPLLLVAAAFQVCDGVQGVGAGVLRGAGDTRYTFAANMVGHWLIGLPVALLLGLRLGGGVTGLWWGLCTGLSAVAAALFSRFLRISAQEIVPLTGRLPRSEGVPCP